MIENKVPFNQHVWLIEPLFESDTFIAKRMFGCLACYLHGRLKLVLADSDEPWNGVLIATAREHHQSLMRQLPELIEHEVLGKWLYISCADERFETGVRKIVSLCLSDDIRIGVLPSEKKRKRRKKREEPSRKKGKTKKRS
ncbi:MAG: hypothetical protein J5J00_00855 [Deltaproteobacteria bacterium]|nr:hypothetical protein [Deltaproteobacteria bacterium]